MRLLTWDGRIKARWQVRAEQVVLADHGQAALLVSRAEHTLMLHRLELTTRRLRFWARVPGTAVAGFDGRAAVIVHHGLRVLDTLSPGEQPRVLWRELDPGVHIMTLTHGSERLSAVLRGPAIRADGQAEVWTWRLPDFRLVCRVRVPEHWEQVEVTSSGTVAAVHGGEVVRQGDTRAPALPIPGAVSVSVTGLDLAVRTPTHLHLLGERAREPSGVIELPDGCGRVGHRRFGDLLTMSEERGRLVVVDTELRQVIADLRLGG